jgi:hypothetical protein
MYELLDNSADVPKHLGVLKDHSLNMCVMCAFSWVCEYILSTIHGMNNFKVISNYYYYYYYYYYYNLT